VKNLPLGFLFFLLLFSHLLFAAESPASQVSFEENQGQWPSSVHYVSSTSQYRAALTSDGLRLSPTHPTTVPEEIVLRWIDSKARPEISARTEMPYHSNYFVGNDPREWKTAVPFFGEVTYHGVYPGISVAYHAHGKEIEQDIHIEPGADPAQFRFRVEGASKILVGTSGELILESRDGSFTLALPRIYQLDRRGQQSQVAGHYEVQGSIVSFRLGHYDHHQKLIIDPVLSYSTYLPKINLIFATFPKNSLSANSTGATCVSDGAVLYGYDANGNVVFTIADPSAAIKVIPVSVFEDEQGNCFVAGQGVTVPNARPLGIAKVSSTGSLIYTIAFSGTSNSGGLAVQTNQVVADSSGNAYVIGTTDAPDLPLKNPIQNLLMGARDAFILKLNPTGSSLVFSTYFGTDNAGNGIAVDSLGNAYVTGVINQSGASDSSIPVTQGVFQSAPKSQAPEAWVAKINANGGQVYGTYLGGSGEDLASGIAVDGNGNAYVVGLTCSTDFPTKNAFQSTIAASGTGCGLPQDNSGFLSKIAPDASALVYSTFLGGSDGAQASAVVVDNTGAAYVAGTSAGVHFPLLNPIQSDFLDPTPAGDTFPPSQVFVTAFDTTGSGLQYSTFFGGSASDFLIGIGVDAAHNLYLAGGSLGRTDTLLTRLVQGFPILNASNGLFQPFFSLCTRFGACGFQGFVAKISPNSGTALASPATVDFATVIKGQAAAVAILVANAGSTDLTVNNTAITGDYSISKNTCAGSLLSAKHCEVDVIFGPTAGGTRTGVLTLTSTAPDSPRNIQLTGIGGVPIVSLNPTSLSLNSPSIGASGATQTVVLSNTGADILNITSLSITGTNAVDFSETHDCASGLGAGLSCNVNLTYKASTSNTESASLQFVDNAAGSPHMVALTGSISAFGLTIAPGGASSATVSAGQMATYNLMIGGPGFSGNVTLTCTGAPLASSCSVPSSESLSSTPTAFQATVMTTARSTAIKLLPRTNLPPAPVAVVVSFGLVVMMLLTSRRKRMLIALASISIGVVLMASCGGGGGGGGTHGTPSGTSTIVVTATNGTTSQSMNLTLNVN